MKNDAYESIVSTLDIFYRSVQAPLSLIDPTYETVFCLPSFEYNFWPPELVKAQSKRMEEMHLPPTMPFVVTDHFDIHTGMFRLPNHYLLVIGPVSSHSLDEEAVRKEYGRSLSPELERAFLNAYRTSIPADIIRFTNLMSMAAHLIFGSHPSPIEIIEANFPGKAELLLPNQPTETASLSLPKTDLEELLMFENMLTEAVRSGNAAYLKQTLRTLYPLFHTIEIHSPEKEPYSTLPLLALMRFAAMHGGADKEKTYQIYDHSVRTLLELDTSGDHIALIAHTAEEFCGLVVESRYNDTYKNERNIIEHYVTHHLSEHITLKDLAAACSLSERQISRVFEECFRMKMPDYIHRERINRAVTLLSSSNYTISEVSSRLGYASQSHFSSTFKKYTGMTPGEFLKHPVRFRGNRTPEEN